MEPKGGKKSCPRRRSKLDKTDERSLPEQCPTAFLNSLGCKDIKGRGEADVEVKVTADPFSSMRKVFLVLFYSQGSLGIRLRGSVGARFLNKYKSRD